MPGMRTQTATSAIQLLMGWRELSGRAKEPCSTHQVVAACSQAWRSEHTHLASCSIWSMLGFEGPGCDYKAGPWVCVKASVSEEQNV